MTGRFTQAAAEGAAMALMTMGRSRMLRGAGAGEKGMTRETRKSAREGRKKGSGRSSWILLDYESVIIHIFTPEARAFYDLDRLWQDGIPVDPAEYLTK